MMFAVPSDKGGRFLAESGGDNILEVSKQKLIVQALLMQSASAEMLHKAGKSRITYTLLEDASGKPAIETLRLPVI